MSEHDFLHALKEDLPEGFAQELKAKLDALDEPARNKRMDNHRTFWTVAAASVVTVLLGIILLVSRVPQLQMLGGELSFTQHDTITSENIDQLQPFATLGNGSINAIHIMPDGEHLLVAASTGLFLHDAHDLNAEPEQITSEAILSVDVDEQGNIYGITAPPFGMDYQQQTVIRWDAATNGRRDLLQSPDGVVSMGDISVKPDGSQMMIQMCTEMEYAEFRGMICAKQQFAWYDTTNMELITIDEPDSIDARFNGQYTIADNWSFIGYFVDANDDPDLYEFTLQLISIETREIRTVLLSNAVAPYVGVSGGLNRLVLSADGQRLLLQNVGHAEYATILEVDTLWNSSEPIDYWRDTTATLYQTANDEDVFAVGYTFSPDGRSVYAASYGNLFRYNLSGEVNLSVAPTMETTSQMGGWYEPPVFTPDGQIMYALHSGNVVMAYDVATLEIVDTLIHYDSDYNQRFQFSADGSRLALTTYHGVPSIWTINTDLPTSERVLLDGDLRSVTLFALSPDGATVAYQDRESLNGATRIQRLDDDSSRRLVERELWLHDLSFLPDGSLVGMRYENGLVRYSVEDIFNDNPEPQVNRMYVPGMGGDIYSDADVSRITVSPNSQWVAVSRCRLPHPCDQADFTIWDIEAKERVTIVADATAFKDYGSMVFSPDSQLFAFGYCTQPQESMNTEQTCIAGEVRIYTMESLLSHGGTPTNSTPLEPLVTLTGFENLPTNIAFNPIQQDDGSWLFAITEWNTRTQIWRIHPDGTAEMLRILDDVRQPIAFDPTGGLMFTTADTAQTEVWGVPLP